MRHAWKIASVMLLSALALVSAMFAGYLFSILRMGRWAYPELVAPLCGSVISAVLAASMIAWMNRRRRGIAAFVRLAALLTLGCFTVAAVVFFGLVANCSWSCESRIVAESRSPNGQWKAVMFSKSCDAAARYCPLVSRVAVLPIREGLPGGDENLFSIADPVGLKLEWKSDDVLRVLYYSGRFLRQQKQVADVHVEYLPVGFM